MDSRDVRRPRVQDLVAAVAATAVYTGFAQLPGTDGQPAYPGPPWLAVAIALGVGAPLVFRRRWPLAALGVILAALTAATLLDLTREPYLAAALAAHTAGSAPPSRRSASALAAALAVVCAGVYAGQALVTPSGDRAEAVGLALLVAAVVGGAWALGSAARARRERESRWERHLAERAAAEERLRIARDMHDAVSHTLGLITVRAGVAAHVPEADPRAALRDIEEIGRSALTDVRRTLGALREGGPLSPADGDLREAIEDAERAGVDVESSVGGLGSLADGPRALVHRIVREALANAVKHATPTRCRITVAVGGGTVAVDVVDEGPAGRRRPRLPGGHGLAGLRERVLLYGGELSAAPRPGGGFAVSARLPVAEEGR
ncbi:sensor histidine kinase [Nocardiopsis changdeensis]|uniref:histidine kinase n=1 Tax=Nocardiopsis changdeensis TaxID=2831969 RepID=A0ABX8BU13_9ACTN|nr:MULTISPECIES: sensor histidine kinase [Nocardiopsis]QUX25180.1 sensor histidine kinase [Nocardiopsis changdeensis]QYX35567.1 sensor histidine kinase [Nocardiopsis sp. MT53]